MKETLFFEKIFLKRSKTQKFIIGTKITRQTVLIDE